MSEDRDKDDDDGFPIDRGPGRVPPERESVEEMQRRIREAQEQREREQEEERRSQDE